MDPVITLLRDLVAIDSVNPGLVPGARGEGPIAAAIAAEMRDIGLDVQLHEAAPGRPNVVGVLEGRRPGRSLMFCGHTDTVGVQGMAAPFDPVVRNGCVYGRGSQDAKGGVAAMIAASRRLAHAGGLTAGRLMVAAVVDEEHASLGADALVATRRADAAVVTEPTDLGIGVAHKGFAWVEVTTEGRAAHGSRPADGEDAIMRMGRVLVRLDALDRALQSRPPHPRLGVPSLHASVIAGGRELSSYPDRCVLQVERRTVIGESGELAREEVDAILAGLRAEDPAFRGSSRLMVSRAPYEIADDHEIVTTLTGLVNRTGRRSERVGVSFWTDAAGLAGAGIPAVVFGPGGGGLHGVEEFVRIDDVLACRDVLVDLARTYCA
jgi:acetylornithine deacetylase